MAMRCGWWIAAAALCGCEDMAALKVDLSGQVECFVARDMVAATDASLGFSALDVIQAANAHQGAQLFWMTGEQTALDFSVEIDGGEVAIVLPEIGVEQPRPHCEYIRSSMSVPVTVRLATTDGRLDESISRNLTAIAADKNGPLIRLLTDPTDITSLREAGWADDRGGGPFDYLDLRGKFGEPFELWEGELLGLAHGLIVGGIGDPDAASTRLCIHEDSGSCESLLAWWLLDPL